MNRRLLALVTLTGLVLPARAADEPKPADPLEPFARFVGGAWSVPEGLHRSTSPTSGG